jgi:hypothetical protein
LYRILNSFFFFATVFLFDEKIRKSDAQATIPVRLGDPKASSNPKMCSSRIFGDRFVEKEGGLGKYKPPATGIWRLDGFLYYAVKNFELLSKIQGKN